MNLVECVLNSYSDDSAIGDFGSKMLEAITKEAVDTQEYDEIKQSIAYLKHCESNSDLLWIDFYSWNNIPLIIRRRLMEQTTILEWGAAYMSFNEFEKLKPIFEQLDNYIFYILKCGDYYRAIILGGVCDAVYNKDVKYLKLIDDVIKESTLYKFSTNTKEDN